jgi:hypothetical protein
MAVEGVLLRGQGDIIFLEERTMSLFYRVHYRIVLLAAGITIMANAQTMGGSVSLNFDSLPSAQGWSYGGNFGENHFFSIVDGMLHQDTVTGATDGYGGGGYNYTGTELVADGSFDIQVRARVTAYDMFDYGHGIYNGAGFGVAFIGPTCTALLYISDTCCQAGTNNPAFYTGDNTVYHDYRMTDNLNGTYTVYRDSVVIGILPIIYGATGYSMPYLLLGDMTNGANAIADITAFSYTSIPEPGMMLLLGLGGMLVRRRS